MHGNGAAWPALDYAAWQDSCATLHRWTQIVGKIRLARTPWLNHGWHVPLYVTSRGLTTSPIPHGSLSFQPRESPFHSAVYSFTPLTS